MSRPTGLRRSAVAASLLVVAGLAGAGAAVPASAASVSAATPAAAAGPACTNPTWSDKTRLKGWAIDKQTLIRQGPSDRCAIVAVTPGDHTLYKHCAVYNADGKAWWHVRIAGTHVGGWVYGGNVTGTTPSSIWMC